jgi:hypothetical protein
MQNGDFIGTSENLHLNLQRSNHAGVTLKLNYFFRKYGKFSKNTFWVFEN